MSGERAWVETLKTGVEAGLLGQGVIVETGRRLPYAVHVSSYHGDHGERSTVAPTTVQYGYQTDLLIAEPRGDGGEWVPRVVIEFKLGTVSTHDALTYSAKAATHKNVHPYLRYGIVIGDYAGPVPRRLLRHGHHFDFMLTIPAERLSVDDERQLLQLLTDEIEASRSIETLIAGRSSARLLHRRLALTHEAGPAASQTRSPAEAPSSGVGKDHAKPSPTRRSALAKYDPLRDHLTAIRGDRWRASFKEIEKIIGTSLPPSARKFAAWWENDAGASRVQAHSWLKVGWRTEEVDVPSERVTFQRART